MIGAPVPGHLTDRAEQRDEVAAVSLHSASRAHTKVRQDFCTAGVQLGLRRLCVISGLCRRTSACQLYPESGGVAAEHASAQRLHAREEGVAFGSATLHGDKIHEDRAFIVDAVDIGGFPTISPRW